MNQIANLTNPTYIPRPISLSIGGWLVTALVVVTDAIAVWLVAVASHVLTHTLIRGNAGNIPAAIELATLLVFVFFFTNALRGRYQLPRYINVRRQMADVFSVWTITMVAFTAIAFLARSIDDYSRATVVFTYLAGIPAIALVRLLMVRWVSKTNRMRPFVVSRILVVGREADVAPFVKRHRNRNPGFMVSDVVLLRQTSDRKALDEDLSAAVALARRARPDSVFLVLPWSEQATIEHCAEAFLNTPVAINLAPEWVLDRFDSPRISHHGELASLELTRPAMSAIKILMKRVFDVAGALTLLVLSAPVIAMAAIAIKREDSGPVLFYQRRFGFNQKPFQIIKLRTMWAMDDGDVVRQASLNDARVTRVGAILRRFNIDELPQLINVLRGEMSLVGPRPHALAHDREYERKIAQYARRHNVKPGITGWAQIHGLRGETETVEKMSRRVSFDLWYIDNWSAWLDIVILLRTVLSRRAFENAY